MRISDWSSDVCSSDLVPTAVDGIGLNLNFNPGVTFVPANALGNTGTLTALTGGNYTVFTSTTPVTGSGHDRIVGLNYSHLTGASGYDGPKIGRAAGRERVCKLV